MKYIKIALVVIVFVGAAYAMNVHAEQQEVAYQKYEDCVQKQYGMLPSTYYAINGTTPDCN